MAIISIATTASADTNSLMAVPSIGGIVAAEDIGVAKPVTLNSSGQAVIAGSAILATNHEVNVVGWTPVAYKSGESVTLFVGGGIIFDYSTGMVPGTPLYLSASPLGRLDTSASSAKLFTLGTASTGSTVVIDNPAAMTLSATKIVTLR